MGTAEMTRFVAGIALWLGTVIAASGALALTGGKDVASDDIGALASVSIHRNGSPSCGGVVFGDRYILTTAHCFTDGRGHLDTRPAQLRVFYWSTGQRETRLVEKLAAHENYPFQEGETARLQDKAWNFDNFPVNHEDIAVLTIKGTHPPGALSAVIKDIDNNYTGRSEGDNFYFMYGASPNGVPGRLQSALIGQYGKLDRVVPGKKPDPFYTVRQMSVIVSDKGFDKDVSQCKGDSGSGVFLAKTGEARYDEEPDPMPTELLLDDGHPILVGLVSNHPVNSIAEMRGRCGRHISQSGFRATRVDYYAQWIRAKTRELGYAR